MRREIQSRGGKASAAKLKESKMVREALLELLTKPSRSTKGKGNACKTSYDLKSLEDALNDGNNTTVMVQILLPYIQKAKEGDVGVLRLLLDILGQANSEGSSPDSAGVVDGSIKIHLMRGDKPADESGGADA